MTRSPASSADAFVAWPTLRHSLVAILRGVFPDKVEGIVAELIEAGFEAIEVPLNSPDAFSSIEKIVKMAPANCLIGAGTVLSVEDVDRLNDVGGRLMVSPNAVPAVIKRAHGYGMVTMPGVLTPTEALSAVQAGASGLKFFPASVLGPDGIKAMMTVLPAEIEIAAVGGVSQKNFDAYRDVGISTFGLGSSLYAPGATRQDVRAKARDVIDIYRDVFGVKL